jgi:membrane-associated phospholipid phosphatase
MQYHEIYCISSYDVVLKYILIAIICISVFIIIGIMLSSKLGYQNPYIIKVDATISSIIDNSGSSLTDDFMIWMSMYGREVVWSMVIVFMSIFAGWKGKKIALILVISFLIIIPLNTLFKNFFERPRPPVEAQEIHISQETDFAYPSGHASIVTAGALTLIILYRREKELILSIILASEAALVCISRIYLGDHYLFDVIGGILLGAGISLLSISLSRYLDPILISMRKYLKKSI